MVETYSRYEAALTALASTPGRLAEALTSADVKIENGIAAARADAEAENARLAQLRATASSHYQAAAAAAAKGGAVLPPRVRPAPGVAGDPTSLASALDEQRLAEQAITEALDGLARAAQQSVEAERLASAEALRRLREQRSHAQPVVEDVPARVPATPTGSRAHKPVPNGSRVPLPAIAAGAAMVLLLIVLLLLVL